MVGQKSLFGDHVPNGCLTKAEAETLLLPHRERLCNLWLRAWQDWHTFVSEEGRSRLDSLSCATCVNRFARVRAVEEFTDVHDVNPDTHLGFFKLYVGDNIVIRLKKLRADRRAMNVDTDQQKAWFSNTPIEGIPEGCTRISVGYILSPAGDTIQDICATFQVSVETVGWWFSVLDDVSGLQFPTTIEPIQPVPLVPIMPESKEGSE